MRLTAYMVVQHSRCNTLIHMLQKKGATQHENTQLEHLARAGVPCLMRSTERCLLHGLTA